MKSAGLSIQDISMAHMVYRKAIEKGIGTEFQFYNDHFTPLQKPDHEWCPDVMERCEVTLKWNVD